MMRAPDTNALDAVDEFDAMVPYGTFSPAQWQKIKADLAAVGIDLDTAKLPSIPDKPWWLPGDFTLRDAIQHVAGYYGLLLHPRLQFKPPTPLQRAEELQATHDALATALARIDQTDLADDHTWRTGGVLRPRIERRYDLQDAITQEIADLKHRIAALKAKGSASAANPKTLRNDYWRDQARLWLALKPNVSSRDQRAHLRRYLVHCSASLFPDVMTEPEIESKIDAFVDNYFRSGKRRPK
jgi:hypothetical protein